MRKSTQGIYAALLLGMLFSACTGSLPGGSSPSPKGNSTPGQSPTETSPPFLPTDVPPSNATHTPILPAIWISPALPDSFLSAFAPPPGWQIATKPEDAAIQLYIGSERQVSTWIYALAAPFPTVADGVSAMDLRQAWSGQAGGPFGGRPLLMDQNTLDVFSALWGIPAPGASLVVSGEQLADSAWADRPAWAIVPWETLSPRWKVLEVNGQSPMRKEFDPAAYPLAVPISFSGDSNLFDPVATKSTLPATNRDPAKMTTLLLTGVTALVRATANTMERKGVLYPAQDIGELLRSADLTHVSNEIPFAQNCPPPNPAPDLYPFCSDPRYIELLEYIGVDIVEMTGNHVRDYGSDALLYTLDLYTQRGWPFYASGKNLEAARKPVLLERNGNRLAFIGCNKPGYNGEWATDILPGAAPCDFDYLRTEIAQLRADGYLPVMTFQYIEYYQYESTEEQARDFHAMADAGAVVVSGSQAHHPQTFDFAGGSLIHYGLGNLFFDQFNLQEGTQNAFIDRHVFYDGRYLGAELITILFVDYARPRFMTPKERADFLTVVFAAGGW
jgi:poly-gamma-glutamate synthesis protein (capsule biosynthesis protein)